MKTNYSLITFALFLSASFIQAEEQLFAAKPSPEQVEWLAMNTMFVCLDPATWQGREYDNHSVPLSQINPDKLSSDQWCEVAKSWGAGQILFVAKHTGGFCWWQTDTTDYGIKETPYKNGKGDILAELSQSCKKYGLKLAIYVSPADDRFGAKTGAKTKDPKDQETYNKIYRQQWTEVLSRYGEVAEIWFDGSNAVPVQDIIEKYAPKAMQFQGKYATIRWPGNESGIAPYPTWQTVKRKDAVTGTATAANSDPNGDVWLPFECDTTLIDHKWFFAPNLDPKLKSVNKLMSIYYTSVGRGSPLLLNSTPDTTGLIPESHVKRYKEFAAEIKRRFDKPVAENNGGNADTVTLKLPQTSPVNHVILAEDVREGQRIRQYVIEGKQGDNWITLVPNGSSVGFKRIDEFKTQTVSELRLRITKSAGVPLVTKIAAYNVTDRESVTAADNKLPIEKDWVEVITAGQMNPGSSAEPPTVFDISKYVLKPGEYRVVIRNAKGEAVEAETIDLIVKDSVIENRVRKSERNVSEYLLNRQEQVTPDTPTKLRIKMKGTFSGSVMMRLAN
jgi:alpha-L-fucosidase